MNKFKLFAWQNKNQPPQLYFHIHSGEKRKEIKVQNKNLVKRGCPWLSGGCNWYMNPKLFSKHYFEMSFQLMNIPRKRSVDMKWNWSNYVLFGFTIVQVFIRFKKFRIKSWISCIQFVSNHLMLFYCSHYLLLK